MDFKKILILCAVAVGVGSIGTQVSFAGETAIAPGVILSNDQVIVVIGIGAAVAIISALQGFEKSTSDWDGTKFLVGVKDTMLITIPFALATAVFNSQPMVYDYVMLFFAVWGASAAYRKSKDPTIPSTASDAQIQRLLDEKKFK